MLIEPIEPPAAVRPTFERLKQRIPEWVALSLMMCASAMHRAKLPRAAFVDAAAEAFDAWRPPGDPGPS